MIPMAFVGGMMGQFMQPIPLNVPVAMAISLFVAYVFTPYFAKVFLKYKFLKCHMPKDEEIGVVKSIGCTLEISINKVSHFFQKFTRGKS